MNNFTVFKKNFNILLKSMVLFFTVFSIHIKGLPVTPRILIMIITSLYVFSKKYKPNIIKTKIDIGSLLWLFFLAFQLFYTWAIIILNNVKSGQQTALSETFNFLIFIGYFPLVIKNIFKSTEEFCKAMTIAAFVQSIIVIASLFFPDIRIWLEKVQEINFDRYSWRVVGLGIAGAGGSVYLVCGVITCIYLLLFFRNYESFIWYLFLYINLCAIALVGRTGLYSSMIIIAYYYLYVDYWQKKRGILTF